MSRYPVLAAMKHHGAPLTREEYLHWAYLGNPPAQLDAEEEAMLPPEFQLRQMALDNLEELLRRRADELESKLELSDAESNELFHLKTELEAIAVGIFPEGYDA